MDDRQPAAAGKVMLRLHRGDDRHNSTSSSALPLAALHGLTRQQMEAGGNVHDVGIAYVRHLGALGIHPSNPDQFISMRIHGVTPEFIQNLQSRGMRNLSADQLVSLRIHGIDD